MTGNGFKGVPIGYSAKSILTAWLRAALFIATPFLVFFALIASAEALGGRGGVGLVAALVQWLMFSGAVAVLVLSYVLSRAGLNRALEMADQLGVSRLAVAKVVHPDRTDEELLTQISEDEVQPGYKHYP